MTETPKLICAGCGAAPDPSAAFPFRCPEAGRGDVDHVLVRRVDPDAPFGEVEPASDDPFVLWRSRLLSYERALAAGMDDAAFVALVRRLGAAVEAVDGRRFHVTPLMAARALADALDLSAVYVKDETGHVSGSHKARHLMGVLLHLEWRRALGLETAVEAQAPLAIASCGNAALAAAVLARAAERPLEVYVPTSADPAVVDRLAALGARVISCPRREGETGDPSYLRFQEAVSRGALPFTCQGNENGLVIEGGQTLAYELAEALAEGRARADRLFVQVGGGALASACVAGLEEALDAGRIARLPRLHAVQTEGGWPLVRAYGRLAARIDAALEGRPEDVPAPEAWPLEAAPEHAARADRIRAAWGTPPVEAALRHAATHRSEYMRPWPTEPVSVAHGILDDETYDWLAVVRGMLRTGGHPVVVGEALLREANALGRERTGIPADATGTSGLAGLMALRRAGVVGADEAAVVLFTGVDRRVEAGLRRG